MDSIADDLVQAYNDGYKDGLRDGSTSVEALTAERDRFKARAEAAEADMKRIADDMDGETDACYPCAICAKNNSRCDTSDNCFEWRGPQEGAAK